MCDHTDKIEGNSWSICPECRQGSFDDVTLPPPDSQPFYVCDQCSRIFLYSVSGAGKWSDDILNTQSIGNRIKRAFNILRGRAV